ncbi:MAG TPA: hypothetical protein VFA84_15705 [Acidimicrobiales bacterium]|nr:hypothetical protein [Acidimicrobiales bacterium]
MSAAPDRVEALEQAGPLKRGVLVWFAVFGGLGAWTVHLVASAAMARWLFNIHEGHWPLDVVTAVCVVVTLVALALSWRLYRIAGTTDEGDADDAGQLRFLASLGLLFNIINLALIVIEGAYAVALFQAHALQ